MSVRSCINGLSALLTSDLEPAPVKVWRKSQADAMSFIDQAISGGYAFPLVVLVTAQDVADDTLSDGAADRKTTVDVWFIRARALTTEETGDGYATIEEWGEDFGAQMRALLWEGWSDPITVDDPYVDATTASQMNQFLYGAQRKLPYYAVGCGTSFVASVG